MNSIEQIFVVGSGRSGTTMLSRILNIHNQIFTFHEMHFLGLMYSSNNLNTLLKKKDSVNLLSELLAIQENGIFLKKRKSQFKNKSEKYLGNFDNLKAVEVYKIFLETVTKEKGCTISCEHTPRNIFYLPELFLAFPNAKFIHMVRDSRDVLLSQKKKWKRRFLGVSKIPLLEVLRSYLNYHPITSSKFWQSAVLHGHKMEDNDRVKSVKFEQLLHNPRYYHS